MIAYRLHNDPGTAEVITRVRTGDIGDPRIFVSSFTQPLQENNHRALHGYDGGPMPDMGVYPLNAVRSLYGDEPIEVCALGTKTPGSQMKMEHDTVSVTLKFPNDRVAQFTVGYTQEGDDGFKVTGTKGLIDVHPSYFFGPSVSINYTAKIEGKVETKKFNPYDQFAGETDYFSNCILNNLDPEADGEEGWLDVRVVVAVKKSLETGQSIKLEPYKRTKSISSDQVRKINYGFGRPQEFIGRDSDNPGKR